MAVAPPSPGGNTALASATTPSNNNVLYSGPLAPASKPQLSFAQANITSSTQATTTFEVALPLQNQSALPSFIASLSDRTSPNYHHYLTPAQFAAQFGPSTSAIDNATNYFRSFGMTVSYKTGDQALTVTANTAQLSSATHANYVSTVVPGGVTSSVVAATTPSLPSSVASDVKALIGIYYVPAPFHSALAPVSPTPNTVSPIANTNSLLNTSCSSLYSYLTPNTLSTFYGIDPYYSAGLTGAGQTIGLIEYSTFLQSDVNAFDSCLGISPSLVTTTVGTGPTLINVIEPAADIENVNAILPKATVNVFQGGNWYDVLQAAVNSTVKVFSDSWGICEAGMSPSFFSPENTLFAQAAAEGQTWFAASGDFGSSCGTASGPISVMDPASQPYVTAVGGSYLIMGNGSSYYASETSWTNGGVGMSGGGLSTVQSAPTWQTGPGTKSSTNGYSGCTQVGGCRQVPDVAMDAGIYPLYYNGSWATVQGTSLASPMWATFISLVNTACNTNVGFINPQLYSIAQSNPHAFNVMTTGYTNGLYTATANYNMVTGLGSPNMSVLGPELCNMNLTNSATTPPDIAVSTPQTSLNAPVGTTVTIPVTFSVTGNQAATIASTAIVNTVGAAGAMNATSNTCTTVQPGSSCTVDYSWTPSTSGTTNINLSWTTNGLVSAQPFSLTINSSTIAPPTTTTTSSTFTSTPSSATVTLSEPSGSQYTIPQITFSGTLASMFSLSNDTCSNTTLAGGATCSFRVNFSDPTFNSANGLTGSATVQIATSTSLTLSVNIPAVAPPTTTTPPTTTPTVPTTPTTPPAPPSPPVTVPTPPRVKGYWTVTANGKVTPYNGAGFFGDMSSYHLNKPIVGIVSTADGNGYWLVASDGGIFSFGDANFHGSTGAMTLNKPIVGIASTPDGHGYWLVASDGGIFAFGDAQFYGSTGAMTLNKPIVGIASTPDGRGYWLVASDGGIFAFGDAQFYGSTGAMKLNKPIVGIASTADGHGYWLVASDGGVFTFGDAQFYGSAGAMNLTVPVTSIVPSTDGKGYVIFTQDGKGYTFGDGTIGGSSSSSSNSVIGSATAL